MDDLISRKWLVDFIEEGRTIIFDTERDYNWMIHLIRDTAPPAKPDTYEAIRILDAIRSSGRLGYGDYCDLHDAISEIGWTQE